MPLTQLEAKPALIVIDLQKGIVGLPTAHPSHEIASNSAAVARAFRAKGFPVVLVNVAGGAPGRTDVTHQFALPEDWADLIPELEQHPSDHTVTKLRWGAFHETGLDHHLKDLGVTQVFVCGIATSMGVESTARHAHELGYHVVLIEDAMTDLDPQSHAHSLEKVFPRLGEVTQTNEALAAVLSA
jgi:nicotinamidase-related amidase